MTTFYRLIIVLFVLSACSLTGGGARVSEPPVVQIASGIGSAPYQEGVEVILQAVVDTLGGDVTAVEFSIDNRVIGRLDDPNPDGLMQFVISEVWLADAAGTRVLRVSATRRDGTSGEDTATLNVVGGTAETSPETQPVVENPATVPPPQQQPTQPPAVPATQPSAIQPTQAPVVQPVQPTQPPVTSGTPQAVFDRLQNVRAGPGLNFTRVGTFGANDRADILAVSPDGEWLKVRFGAGEAWVYAPLVQVQGSIGSLPRDPGPATPAPVSTSIPTAVPPPVVQPTQPSVTELPNLAVTNIGITVPSDGSSQPKCGVPFVARVTIQNTSNVPTSTGLTLIQNVHVASGTINGSSGQALIPVNLDAGGSHTVEATFTIDTFIGEEQRLEFIADANNEVAESNENDNRNGITYILDQGVCP